MPRIVLKNLTKQWNGFYAVDHLSLVIEDHSFVTLLGPSGCGKTTILRMIAGLETPTSGKIMINGETVFDSNTGVNIPANKRHIGFLFQNYALWPHMTAYQNIIFGLENMKEEMPKISSEYIRYTRMAEALKDPIKYVALIQDFATDDARVDSELAIITLIDEFSLSYEGSKELFSLRLDKISTDKLNEEATKYRNLYLKKADDVMAKIENQGYSLSEKGEYLLEGKVVREIRHLDKEEMDLRVREVARTCKISEFLGRYPSELSGGQQQRVAIARTLAPWPTVLFMDEPLSNLDAKLRLDMQSEMKHLRMETDATFVYVTHDQLEAMNLSSKICLINNGVLQQYDVPLDVYKKPANTFVADFVGSPSINFLEVSGKQNKDDVDILLFGEYKAKFIPNVYLNLADFRKERDEKLAVVAEENNNSTSPHKTNTDRLYNYHIHTLKGDIESRKERHVDPDSFVLGIRPEFVSLSNEKKGIDSEVYSALPSGRETMVKLRINEFIITGLVLGGVDYRIGAKALVSFEGKEILLYDRKSGDLVAQGALKLL
jgi:iron(III) transport system ATP-binding protein